MTYQDYEDFVKDYNVLSAKLQNAQDDLIAYAGVIDEVSSIMEYYRKNVFSVTYRELMNSDDLSAKEKLDCIRMIREMDDAMHDQGVEVKGEQYLSEAYDQVAADLAEALVEQIDLGKTTPVYYEDCIKHDEPVRQINGAVLEDGSLVSIATADDNGREVMEINILDPAGKDFTNYYIAPKAWTESRNAEAFMRLLAKAELVGAVIWSSDDRFDLLPDVARENLREIVPGDPVKYFKDSEYLFDTDSSFAGAAVYEAASAIQMGTPLYSRDLSIDMSLYYNTIAETCADKGLLQQRICNAFLREVPEIFKSEVVEEKDHAVIERCIQMMDQMKYFDLNLDAPYPWYRGMSVPQETLSQLQEIVKTFIQAGFTDRTDFTNFVDILSDIYEKQDIVYVCPEKRETEAVFDENDRFGELYVVTASKISYFYDIDNDTYIEAPSGQTVVAVTGDKEKAEQLQALLDRYGQNEKAEIQAKGSIYEEIVAGGSIKAVGVYGDVEDPGLVYTNDGSGFVVPESMMIIDRNDRDALDKAMNMVPNDSFIYMHPVQSIDEALVIPQDKELGRMFYGAIPEDVDECISILNDRCAEMSRDLNILDTAERQEMEQGNEAQEEEH